MATGFQRPIFNRMVKPTGIPPLPDWQVQQDKNWNPMDRLNHHMHLGQFQDSMDIPK